MANQEHLDILAKGVEVWNQWRESNPSAAPDLRGAHLGNEWPRSWLFRSDFPTNDPPRSLYVGWNVHRTVAGGAELSGANFAGADLGSVDLNCADLIGADLTGANLMNANLAGARLRDANFNGAFLMAADLSMADVSQADFSGATFGWTGMQRWI